MCFRTWFSMLRRILLHTTPYHILYKGEKLIYTEKFLLKLDSFILERRHWKDELVYITERFYTNFNLYFRKNTFILKNFIPVANTRQEDKLYTIFNLYFRENIFKLKKLIPVANTRQEDKPYTNRQISH